MGSLLDFGWEFVVFGIDLWIIVCVFPCQPSLKNNDDDFFQNDDDFFFNDDDIFQNDDDIFFNDDDIIFKGALAVDIGWPTTQINDIKTPNVILQPALIYNEILLLFWSTFRIRFTMKWKNIFIIFYVSAKKKI